MNTAASEVSYALTYQKNILQTTADDITERETVLNGIIRDNIVKNRRSTFYETPGSTFPFRLRSFAYVNKQKTIFILNSNHPY